MSVCLSVYVYVHLSLSVPPYLLVLVYIRLSVCLPADSYSRIYSFIRPSIYSNCQTIFNQSVSQSVSQSVILSVSQLFCQSVCLFVYSCLQGFR